MIPISNLGDKGPDFRLIGDKSTSELNYQAILKQTLIYLEQEGMIAQGVLLLHGDRDEACRCVSQGVPINCENVTVLPHIFSRLYALTGMISGTRDHFFAQWPMLDTCYQNVHFEHYCILSLDNMGALELFFSGTNRINGSDYSMLSRLQSALIAVLSSSSDTGYDHASCHALCQPSRYHAALVRLTDTIMASSDRDSLIQELTTLLNEAYSPALRLVIYTEQADRLSGLTDRDHENSPSQGRLSSDNNPAVSVILYHEKQRVGEIVLKDEAWNPCARKVLEHFLTHLGKRLAFALYHHRGLQSIKPRKERVNSASQPEAQPEEFQGLSGTSSAMASLYAQIKAVAQTNCTVLLMGETGTGKELVARAIHQLSHRHARKIVNINCAAVPEALLESELFGHERGAFTGATTNRKGRFSQAHMSTLFLDEVGDMPLCLQPKLLRVLQEREYEPIGSDKTCRTDVRIIAATNQDLAIAVTNKQFRSDLFYRLNVFPVTLPPLRHRLGDLDILVPRFVRMYALQMNKTIVDIQPEDLWRLKQYHWPGNVRELANVIERSVILTPGSTLQLRFPEPLMSVGTDSMLQPDLSSWHRLIVEALRACKGVVDGPGGAAARLGLKRTTLLSRMKRLGIAAKDVC